MSQTTTLFDAPVTGDVLLEFDVPTEPRSKGRPRFGRTKQGRPIAFTDQRTQVYEAVVCMAARRAVEISERAFPIQSPVVVELTFALARPKKPRFPVPATKPDVDNLAKAALDGITLARVIADDARIVRLVAQKIYAEPVGVRIVVRLA